MMTTPTKHHIEQIAKHYRPEHSPQRASKRARTEVISTDSDEIKLLCGKEDTQQLRNTIMQSNSPSAGTHLTKTGRVSKAAKGMPVHHCECGKTYTRAEHLRRHQQNHKPGAFPCGVPGCNHTFAREDLLIRHQAKHNNPIGPSESLVPSAQAATLLTDNVPSLFQPMSAALQQTQSLAPSRSRPSLSSDSSRREASVSMTEQQAQNLVISSSNSYSGAHQTDERYANLLSSNNFGNEFRATVPVAPPVDQVSLSVSTENLWQADTWGFNASHSPTLVGSITPAASQRGPSPACVQLHTPSSDQWICSTGSHTDISRNTSFGDVTETGLSMLPECRDILEQNELVTPTAVPKDFGSRQFRHRIDNEQRYLDAFWRLIHPIWPIIHKPTFDVIYASPLLRTSMLTLGACYIGNQADSANACIMHKRCLKVIRKRTINIWHSYRIVDLQAIFLVELFSLYKSRRPPFQLSKPFQDNYCALSRNCDIDTTNPIFSSYGISTLSQLPTELPTVTYEFESEQRLLAAYYILDQEQAALFGRQNA